MRVAQRTVRRRGGHDAADEAENFVAAWHEGRIYQSHARPEALDEWLTAVNKELHVDAEGHRVRVRFQPEPAWNLALGEDTLAIHDVVTGAVWELRLARDESAGRSKAVVVDSSAFIDRATAELAAARLEAALLKTSVQIGYGFALSHRIPPSVITEHGFRHFLPDGIRGFKDDLGVTVYEAPPATVFLHMSEMNVSVSAAAENFRQALQNAVGTVAAIEDRLRTAYELFSSSRFENSSRARFLLLVMAVEAMIDRADRPDNEATFVARLIELVDGEPFSDQAKAALAAGLRELKRKSIGASASAQIAKEVSAEAAAAFKKMYGLRSRLVHGGKPVAPSDLNDASNKLEPIVKAMLSRRLAPESPTVAAPRGP